MTVEHLDDHRPIWLVAREKCRACGYQCISVIPMTADLDRLECSRCKEKASAVTHALGGRFESGGACALFRAIVDRRAEPDWVPRLELAERGEADEGEPAQRGDEEAD